MPRTVEELRKKYPDLTDEQINELEEVYRRAEIAQKEIEQFDQAKVDRLCQAVAWAIANKKTFSEVVELGVKETGIGDPVTRMNKRFKIRGVLRDALRQKSVGLIEEIPEKGIKKYAKPAGIIASLVPTTNPELTPAYTAIYAIKARDAVIFSPHPRSQQTTLRTVEIMREALRKEGVNPDVLQCLQTKPNKAMSMAVMGEADLIMATGGQNMVRRAYTAGKPAYGVGAGNSTVVIDETADIKDAAMNTMLSKTSDFGSGCSADGNLIIEASIFDEMVEELINVGGYLANEEEKRALEKVMWDENGKRLPATVAISPQQLAREAGFEIPEDRKFIMVMGDGIGKEYNFCKEKLTTLLTLFKFEGFDEAMRMVREIFEVGGKGHSCGIYSFNEEHIHLHALNAPVSRIMVRQATSRSNAGSFTNGMPMTSSLGCGTWGGNITTENISLKHYLNITWVSYPIPEDRPSDEELFGEFYDPELEK